jgi:hypothetical protein
MKVVLPTTIYWGLTEAMVAEVGAWDYPADMAGKYAVMGDGEAQFDTIPCHTQAEARNEAKAWAKATGAKLVRI